MSWPEGGVATQRLRTVTQAAAYVQRIVGMRRDIARVFATGAHT